MFKPVMDISIFNPQSESGWRLYHLDIYFIIASSFILLLVIGLLIYIALKFRAKPNDAEPKQIKNNKLIEALMIGIPFIMVSFFFYLTIKTMKETEPITHNETPTVEINGRQWWWQVSYPGTSVVTANEIHLPANKKVLLKLTASDVIHDWWVPSFGPKMDMIPGLVNYLWLKIDKPGIYEGACSEFCGKQHSKMRIRVIAQTQENYQKWLTENAKTANIAIDSSLIKGAAIFQKASCAGCHQIRGTMANGNVGPDLTHLASRQTILSGTVKNTTENLYRFIDNPNKIKPGVNMPRFFLQQDSLKALVTYLHSLK
ncbi:cytochrome c oxidase subunit II [Pedobacter sp. SD-b]|uniref:cytochrome-c oxidase n=1 Tax=Pedobacter segetis TaxID=2793069 RepID=A0ABS1BFA2_9SPHI|nr:cytochrome c oxidase subunit II [Pedobacter segetis]MBK0381543.1 cytochrome c oxidase subunit II [Pedobacter segetis]